ncbi:ensconsin-like isoform X4 [Acipenser ruthenus]|uniref:ensconsin-like isoform X4 n=1 Tax=Acipenser ruthenus TaxID=7906 RepID=UPI0027420EE2|nr:ensconsin-like isoform X4 [Acipenser ruthenus]
MAEGATSLKGLRAQMVAAAEAQAEERRGQTGTSPLPAASPTGSNTRTGAKPVLDGATLRIDDRLRVAKERREEQHKQHAARETQILEREKKAKLLYEKQMEERQRKLEEQRKKEEQRRSAVEEKRKQKMVEEKEHYEAVMLRSLERSQRLEQRQKRWSWGGAVTVESDSRTGDQGTDPTHPVDLIDSSSPAEPQTVQEVDKRSASTMNLKQTDSVINKRLSSSSATLMNSPDKSAQRRSSSLNRLANKATQPPKEPQKLSQREQTARRSHASALDSGFISRLLTPTQASLARSKSTAALSAEGSVPPESHLCPRSASASSIHPPKGPLRSRSIDRQKGGPPSTASSDGAPENTQKPEKQRRPPSPAGKRPPSPSNLPGRRRSPSPSPSPATTAKRPPSPSTAKPSPRNRPPSPSGVKQRPSSPQPAAKPVPIQRPALTPTGPPTLRKREPKPKESPAVAPESPQSPEPAVAASSKTKEDPSAKNIAGTTSAEEAAKILSENRRLAREQKEREELERVQRQEEERIRKEEQQLREEEDRARREEEQRRLEEERKEEEEERERLEEVERARLAREELEKQAELQLQREEADALALKEAEKQRLERERVMQKNQQERIARKKRIEEIMKRTRKGEQNDSKRDEKSDNQGSDDNDEDKMSNTESDDKDGEENETDDFEETDALEESETEVVSMPTESETETQGLPEAESVTQDKEAVPEEGKGAPEEAEAKVVSPDEGVVTGSVNGGMEVEDKENNNGRYLETVQPVAVSLTPKSKLVESSEFLHVNEDDKVGHLSNLNGKSGSWTFEELIDLGVHSKTAVITVDSMNQNLIDAAGIPEGPKVAFEDKTVMAMSKPMEAVSEM